MRSVSMRILTGGLVAGLCILAPTAGPLSAQEPRKPAEAPAAADAGPDPLVEAMLAANQEAASYDTAAATLTTSSPIVIPATGSGGGTTGVSAPYPAQITVAGLPTSIGRLEVRLNHLTHTYPADLDILLVGPGGQNVMLMSDVGGASDVEGAFLTFADGAPALTGAAITSGTYAPTNTLNTDVLPSPAPAGPHGTSLSSFISTNPNGLWSLYVYDDLGADIGRLFGFSLIITPQYANTTPLAILDLNTVESSIVVAGLTRPITKVTVGMYITHTFDADLDVSLVAPDGTVVGLTSDNGGSGDNYGSACTPAGRTNFDDAATTLITAGAAPFVGTFRPETALSTLVGKAASGTWKLRITDDLGADVGILQCWAISITTSEPVQPPTSLTVSSIAGNIVTFKWTPSPAGSAPTSYVFEGGITPGQVLASVPSGVPALTLGVPNGSFFVRVRSISGAETSGASNELPIYVNVAVPPSAPKNLLITANGATLDLTWRNTFEGAAPTGLVLEVGGAVVASLPLPVTESFSYAGVPAGSYSFAVRAVNVAGASATSGSRSATFPSATCNTIPQVPANFRAFGSGATVFVDWDPPGIGAAVSYFILNVTGALTVAVPTTLRALSGAVPPGTYNLSVASVNPCGTGPFTAVKSVTIP
jgi:subtilisin-like proprotein convertase family protein